jgi:hypothetical protein
LFLSKAARCDLFGRFNTLSALSFWPQIAKKDAATIVNANRITAVIIRFTEILRNTYFFIEVAVCF